MGPSTQGDWEHGQLASQLSTRGPGQADRPNYCLDLAQNGSRRSPASLWTSTVSRVLAPNSVEMPPATAGELAVINLLSSLQRAWDVLGRWPDRLSAAERVVGEEQLKAQFLGDVTALDRLTRLASELSRNNPESASTHLIAAQVSSFISARVSICRRSISMTATSRVRKRCLAPVVESGDPEGRLSEVLEAQSKRVEADVQRNAARSGFESR